MEQPHKADFDVSSEKTASQNGELYKGATANKRNIVLTVSVIPPNGKTHDQIREEFFAFFVPRETGTLYFYDGDIARKIEYKTESCEFDMDARLWSVMWSKRFPPQTGGFSHRPKAGDIFRFWLAVLYRCTRGKG